MRKERTEGVSVVIPTYKRPEYLLRLLKSIERQTKAVDEIIVVNDCSPNLKEYDHVISRFADCLEIIYIINKTNVGAPKCRNIGIEESHYKYLALTDDDDEWEPEKNEKEFNLMHAGNYGLIYTHGIAVDENGDVLYKFSGNGRGNDLKAILRECFIPSSSVMVTYEAICEAGLFDLGMPSCQDWDMWVRIIELGYKYDVVEMPLLIYHKHSGESIGTNPRARTGYKIFYRKHLKQYIKLFLISKEYKKCLHALKKALF